MNFISVIMGVCIACMPWIASAQGATKFEDRVRLMSKERDAEKNLLALQSVIKDFELDSIKNAEEIDMLYGTVALGFLSSSNYPMFEKYIGAIKNKFNQTSYMNMAACELLALKVDLDYALDLAKNTVDLYESYIDDKSARPVGISQASWDMWIKMAAYPYYETYASALFACADGNKALFYEEKALRGLKPEDMMQSSLELYAELLLSQGQSEKAYDILIDRVSMGNSSLRMNELLKEVLIARTGSIESSMDKVDSIQKNAAASYRNKLLNEPLKDEIAPYFALADVNGNEVSLDDLKGQVVVLDFWATWCAPCIASMPAMKKISSRHPDVAFVFIATQESGEDPLSRVRSYIEKSKFPENVLIDAPSDTNPDLFSTAVSYKVNALPTKFVIDRNGVIRFTSNGFRSDAELMNELDAMISIAKMQ